MAKRSSPLASVLLTALLGLTGACTARLEGNLQPGEANSSGGSAGVGGAPGQPGGAGAAPVAPGYKAIHQLNGSEYNATVADVLGTTLRPANGSWRVYELNGFDNIADVQRVDADQYQRYFDAAAALADDALGSAVFKAKYITCTNAEATCVDEIVGKLGLHIFRRPLSPTEVATYKNVYTAAQGHGETHEGSLRYVLRALLSSAEFLYRLEFDQDPASAEQHSLSSYELASRISYFLWSSAPDDAMLAAAADQSFNDDDKINSTIERLLADSSRVSRFVENFYGQWLGARRVVDHAVAPSVYPGWSPTLASSLTQEMYAYFREFLEAERSWQDFLTADANFVDAALAAHYGIPAPSGAGLQRVEITTDKRVGFLGLGGFLAQSSLDRRTSPTLRGRWIMINLLCTHPPAPPLDVPKIEVAAGSTDLSRGNVRAVLEKHRTNPTCASCHELFDPYGLPLEQFDAIGAYRTTYADGSAVVPETTLLDGTKLAGLDQLATSLAKDPRFSQCVADNMFMYGLGRALGTADRSSLDRIQKQWNNGLDVPSLRRLIRSIVLDPSFRSRSGQAPR